MKIKQNKSKTLTFKQLVKGDVFFMNGVEAPLMKITACKAASTDYYSNAVTLSTGTLVKVEEAKEVMFKRDAYLGFEGDDEI